ncbi:hypothetical protein HPG69_016669 [Diceros bicornis minor]|uniref:Uncharacterized protein n=1 Tax=Diceros bicornis minor TaxID=77932 RepID=A0A7J7FNH9_DICBM|nr:hypothetical protein HPG69_016669 [Diceros bicornis minor]
MEKVLIELNKLKEVTRMRKFPKLRKIEDLYKVKNKIQEKVNTMAKKSSQVSPKVFLFVQKKDGLTQLHAVLLVNSANEDFDLSGSLAAALLKTAVPQLTRDCDNRGSDSIILRTRLSLALQFSLRKFLYNHDSCSWSLMDERRCLKDQYVETIIRTINESFQYYRDEHRLKQIYLTGTTEKLLKPEIQLSLRKDHENGNILETAQTVKSLRSQLITSGIQGAVKFFPDTIGQVVVVNTDQVLRKSGCNLHCNFILHIVAPEWRNGTKETGKGG